ncbi:MAG: tyrosine-type recombinase/integrase [Pseudomonadota bacterium]
MGRQKKTPGLRKRGEVWHIEKQISGYGTLRESCKTSNLKEAETYLRERLHQIDQQVRLGVRPVRTFADAASKFIETNEHKSLDRDIDALNNVMPFIGDLPIESIHNETLEPYVQHRRGLGIKSSTISRELGLVIRILTLSARLWRDDKGRPWLDTIPMIIKPNWNDKREPYALSWEEQRKLFRELPDHLHRMALFKVNSGPRDHEVCGLRWDWEVPLPKLNTSIFVVPGKPIPGTDWTGTKNKEDRVIVLNRIAKSVVDEVRGQHPTYVFTYRGARVNRMNNSAWKKARKRAGIPIRVHDLRHTFGRRLRAAGVPNETRKDLFGHTSGDITSHYSTAEIQELIDAVELLVEQKSGKSPPITLLTQAAN